MNIILVDDELQILSWLELMLKKTELPLTIMGSFSNGAEALEFCLNHTVDLVITDIRMPIMDGLKLIQQLKREKPQTRFLILTCIRRISICLRRDEARSKRLFVKGGNDRRGSKGRCYKE